MVQAGGQGQEGPRRRLPLASQPDARRRTEYIGDADRPAAAEERSQSVGCGQAERPWRDGQGRLLRQRHPAGAHVIGHLPFLSLSYLWATEMCSAIESACTFPFLFFMIYILVVLIYLHGICTKSSSR